MRKTWIAGLLTACLLTFSLAGWAAGAPPEQVTSALGDGRQLGTNKFTWFGLHVYDAQIWSNVPNQQFDYTKHPCWLELTYARDFKGSDIAERSKDEMKEIGAGNDEKREAWEKKLAEIFPNVKKGDSLSALHVPGKSMQFFHNGKPLAQIQDMELAKAFMGIWLDAKTSEPKMRKKLLGL